MSDQMHIVILGPTSASDHGQARACRDLAHELNARGHDTLFLEREVLRNRTDKNLSGPFKGNSGRYSDLDVLRKQFGPAVRRADLVIVGSSVPEGVAVGHWIHEKTEGLTAFYDTDTPVTLGRLESGGGDSISPDLLRHYDLYLSSVGGRTVERIRNDYGVRRALPLYHSVDPHTYYPSTLAPAWDMGYFGDYAEGRQATLESLLIEPARRSPSGRFVVAGSGYPDGIRWSGNILRIEHVPPTERRRFHTNQRITLDPTPPGMAELDPVPAAHLFEAAACATPIVTGRPEGLREFFDVERELLVAHTPVEILDILEGLSPEELRATGRRGRNRILSQHTPAHRAAELESYVAPLLNRSRSFPATRQVKFSSTGAKPA